MAHERILVVDDEAGVREIVTALLEHNGYFPTAVGSAEEALNTLRDEPGFDLVLSDIMMPGTDGLSLLDSIVTTYPELPVVMCTAVQDVHVATNAFRRGAIDYLLKPFERVRLESVVGRAIELGKLQRQNAVYRHNLEEVILARTERLRTTMQDLERSYDTTLEAMGAALDLRDEETQGHSKRVTAYTIALARAMGLNADELRVIARGAFLHDIGKIAIPDSILLKPGRLNAEEMAVMQQHCQHGYDMVCRISFLSEASEIVYSHQERYDGAGYPRGLKGEEIPLGARIFAIADTLDAITSDRPYRKGRSFAVATEEIRRGAGTQFDPRIVAVFLGLPAESWQELREEIAGLAPAALSARLCRPTVAESRFAGLASHG